MYSYAARFTQLRHLLTVVCSIAIAGGALLVGLGIVSLLRPAESPGETAPVGLPGQPSEDVEAQAADGKGDSPDSAAIETKGKALAESAADEPPAMAATSPAKTRGGLWLIVVGAGTILASIIVWALAYVALKIDANTVRVSATIRDLHEEIERHGAILNSIAESSRLSDGARSIAHRQEELNALRAAIHTNIDLQDWEAARYLVAELERRFGHKEEAQRLGEKVNRACSKFYNQEVARALPRIEHLFDEHNWEVAGQEIGRLLAAFPNEPRFARLQDELAQRREQRKQQLVDAFTHAVQRDDLDIDAGMQILKELDQYLNRNEAAELQEVARKVVKGKLLQLGVRFRFAVTEERWRDALEVGVSIIEEFPNSRMAHEVQDRLNVLRERAGLPADVEVSVSAASKPPS